jgi:hypothetical protein
MSDHHPSELPAIRDQVVQEPRERVGLGLLAALGAVVLGAGLTVVLWRVGFIASITSFAIAFGAIWLYAKAAGSTPRKGLGPLVLLILAGVVLSFFAVVASDLSQTYDELIDGNYDVSRLQFIRDNIFNGELLSAYTKDMAMFGVFAVLGIYSTLRRLLTSR